MRIKTLLVSHFEQNCRLLIDDDSKTITIIDPGGDHERILSECDLDAYTIEQIILTHCHIDHAGGVKTCLTELKKNGQAPPLLYHSKDQFLGDHIVDSARMYGLPPVYDNVPKATRYLDNETSIQIGSHSAEIRFTPGHAPGHIVLYLSKGVQSIEEQGTPPTISNPVLIAGDTLFKQSIGRTDLPMGDYETLIESIKTQLFTLPDDTLVLPGHGPSTTIGFEKKFNPFF